MPPRPVASRRRHSRATIAVAEDGRSILSGVTRALGSLLPGGGAGGAGAGAGGAGGGAVLQGPLGIARMGGELASTDALRLLEFGAILSLNLAVFNSLPLPGLDGYQVCL